MFVGHYAPAFALHRAFPEVRLWRLFVAVQAVDVLFWALVTVGVERMHVDPSRAGSLALVLEFLPYSHSLAAAFGWAFACAVAIRGRAGLVLAAAVLSHWFCDLPVHLADLPLAAGDGLRVGFGLWSHRTAAWALEVGLVAASVVGARPVHVRLAAVLCAVQTLQTFVIPAPTRPIALAAMCEGAYVACAWAAWTSDGARRASRVDPGGVA